MLVGDSGEPVKLVLQASTPSTRLLMYPWPVATTVRMRDCLIQGRCETS